MKYTRIGCIDADDNGTDTYYRIDLQEDDDAIIDEACPTGATPEQVESYVQEKFLSEVYSEGRGPGRPFCHQVTILGDPFNDRQYVGIQHVRWDT
jgi:hypothetical protein